MMDSHLIFAGLMMTLYSMSILKKNINYSRKLINKTGLIPRQI